MEVGNRVEEERSYSFSLLHYYNYNYKILENWKSGKQLAYRFNRDSWITSFVHTGHLVHYCAHLKPIGTIGKVTEGLSYLNVLIKKERMQREASFLYHYLFIGGCTLGVLNLDLRGLISKIDM